MRRSPDAYFKKYFEGELDKTDPSEIFYLSSIETIETIKLISEWVYSEWELYNDNPIIKSLVDGFTTNFENNFFIDLHYYKYPLFKRAYDAYIEKKSDDVRDFITFLYKFGK
jgi:ABC-type long-subunit fatty acid transport system fused permease/ATPase subunit